MELDKVDRSVLKSVIRELLMEEASIFKEIIKEILQENQIIINEQQQQRRKRLEKLIEEDFDRYDEVFSKLA